MKIILISGKAGSGKSEVAKIIKNKLSNSVITSLSKYIKLFALEMTDWNGNDDNKPRTFLQTIGDNLRAIDQNFLLKRMHEDLKLYEKYFDNVIINDIRLLHEIEYFKNIKEYKIITIRVNANTSKRNLTSDEKKHHTETQLDNYNYFDYIIENDYNSNLEEKVAEIMEVE